MKHTHSKYIFYLFVFCFFIIRPYDAVSQRDNFFNPILFNGRLYQYNPYNVGSGTPFFSDSKFHKGKIFIHGRSYQTLFNYDIQRQSLIVYYPYFTRVSMIEIPRELVDSFGFQGMNFIRQNINGKEIYFEKIGNNERYILIKHQKVMGVDSRPDNMIYSQTIKSYYWFDGKKALKFKNRRSFLKLFGKADQQKIKSFWRKNHFKLRRASSIQWREFILFVNKNLS